MEFAFNFRNRKLLFHIFLTFISTLIFTAHLFGQNYGVLQGRIIDNRTKAPLSGVHLHVLPSGKAAVTDKQGNYVIENILAGDHTIRVTHIGYKTIDTNLKIYPIDAVTGKVIDNNTGAPLVDIEVRIKGAPLTTRTEFDGYYIFENMPPGTYTVQVMKPGYKELEISAEAGITRVDFQLNEDIIKAEDIIITGINTEQKKSKSAVQIAQISENARQMGTYADAGQLAAEKISGVQIKKTSGNIGGGYNLIMRSGGGISGNSQPTVYLDGIQIDDEEVNGYSVGGQGIGFLAELNPDEIAHIEFLKGPASSVLHGVHGGNGIILIKTKRGEPLKGLNRLRLNYNFTAGWNQQASQYKRSDIFTAGNANDLFRTGAILQNNVSLSGGSPVINYYFSAGQRVEEGILPSSKMSRKTIRGNIDFLPRSFFQVQISAGFAQNNVQRPHNDDSIFGLLYNTTVQPQPFSEVSDGQNGLSSLLDDNAATRFNASAFVDFEPSKTLSSSLLIGFDTRDLSQEQTFPDTLTYSDTLFNHGVENFYNRTNRKITGTWTTKFQPYVNHDIDLTLLAGAQATDRRQLVAVGANGVTTPLLSGSEASPTDTRTHQRELGFFSEATLTYLNTYSAAFKIRRDYASAIGDDASAPVYPGLTVTWRPDKYSWLPKVFSFMKIRAGYGESGVLPHPLDRIRIIFDRENFGNGSAAVPAIIGNPSLKPERVREFEAGFDAEFIHYYGLEFTYYYQKSEDAIFPVKLPPSTGLVASTSPQNVGTTEGFGFETTIHGSAIRSENLNLSFLFINNWQENKIVNIQNGLTIYDPFNLNAFAQGYGKYEFLLNPVLGASWNDNGTYAGPRINEKTLSHGNPIPDHTGSFLLNINFLKKFNLQLLTNWARGHQIWNGNRPAALRAGNNAEYNRLATLLGIAGTANFDGIAAAIEPVAGLEKLLPGTIPYVQASKAFARLDPRYNANFIENADFLKLREISLGYTLTTFSSKISKSEIRIILSAYNLFTITKYSGRDPEVNWAGSGNMVRGQDYFTLQHPRTYNIALRISL